MSRVHAETRRENLIYAQLEAAGAALRAMCFPPFFHLDVSPLRTLNVGMPGTLAADAPAVGTIRALHHRIPITRQINEGPTFQAVNALAQHRPVVEVYKFAVLFAA